MSNDNYIFETNDPLGEEVKLKKLTWENHIIGEHPEREHFIGNELFFKRVVENPDYIFKQVSKSGVERLKYTFYGNINDEGNPKIYEVIADHKNEYKDIVTMVPKNSTKLKESEKTKEAKIYDRSTKNKYK